MCGISGLIYINNTYYNKEEIKQINDLIKHRGPDAEGFYYGNNFAFGHRRLSIIDLSNESNQPMVKNNLVVTYNGEIYNYIEIKEELQKKGYAFNTKSDTEVILAAYKHWGKNCVEHFNGMWSFAIYDKEKNIIFCSRDRFGVKPFYYAHIDNRFVFGSEIKQIIYFFKQRKANYKIINDFLFSGYEEHTHETFFEGVFKLQGGHNLIYNLSNNEYCIEKYYDLPDKEEYFNENSAIDEYEKEFNRSIKYRLRADVPIGTCLSGGMDSSSVAATASDINKHITEEKFKAIHAQSSEIATDESYYAIKVAEAKKLDLSIIKPSTEDFKSIIDEVVYTQEEPFLSPSIFMQYFVMKKAKEIGVKIMLDGQGGDETLLGYEPYYTLLFNNFNIFSILKIIYDIKKNSNTSLKNIAKYIFTYKLFPLRFLRLSFINDKQSLPNNFLWLKKFTRAIVSSVKLQSLEILHTNLPMLLRYEDKNSMRHSIETRLPFLDYKLVELALKISHKIKLKNGITKYVLRKAMEKTLPNEIIWRKSKLGFNAPDNTWINSIKNYMIETISKSELINNIYQKQINLCNMHYQQLWRLFSVAKWEEIYKICK